VNSFDILDNPVYMTVGCSNTRQSSTTYAFQREATRSTHRGRFWPRITAIPHFIPMSRSPLHRRQGTCTTTVQGTPVGSVWHWHPFRNRIWIKRIDSDDVVDAYSTPADHASYSKTSRSWHQSMEDDALMENSSRNGKPVSVRYLM